MKKYSFILLTILPSLFFAQVMVGSDMEPTRKLDIDGNLRIREIPNGALEEEDILLSDEDGFVYKISTENLTKNKSVNNLPKGGDGSLVDPELDYIYTERFIPTLDLWSEQELYGVEDIKDVYFVSLSQLITMPQNITQPGDGKIRKIVFVLMQDNAPEGFDDATYSQAFDQWNIIFQTKKYEMESNGADCYVNDTTYIYQPVYSDLFVPDPANYYNTDGTNDGERSRLKGVYQDQVRDREFVFYDFDGKWVLSARD